MILQLHLPGANELTVHPISASLAPNQSSCALMAIDFNDTTQPAAFQICSSAKNIEVNFTAPVGELLQPNTVTENDFKKLKSKYMNICGWEIEGYVKWSDKLGLLAHKY